MYIQPRKSNATQTVCNTYWDQGWAQGSFVEVEAEVEAERSRQGSNVLNRGKAEAESSRPRRGRLNSRQGRGEATRWKIPPMGRRDFSAIAIAVQNLVALSQTVWQRVNGLVALPSWVEVIYVIPLYGVSRGLNLNLSSVGGRSLKLTDYYRTEARRYLPDRGKTVWGRGEAEPAKKTGSRPPRAEADDCDLTSRTTSLTEMLWRAIWQLRIQENPPYPAEGAYSAPANPLVGGEGLAVPSQEPHSPL